MLLPVSAKDIPVEQTIFTDAWNIVKAYRNIKQDGFDTEWNEAIQRIGQLYEMGASDPYAGILGRAMADGIVSYLNAVSKG